MTRLIIAEKHSVAQAIAQALDTSAIRKDGYLQCADTLVTWAQGHLVNLAAPDQYQDHDWGRWRMDTLPLDPSPDWKLVVNRQKGADRQFKTVQQLIQRDDVTTLINACDPDREGESIFRRVIQYLRHHAGVDKPAMRLWVASLEEPAIRQALSEMKPESAYDGLGTAAELRSKADWLIGMNASRAYTLVYGRRLTVGRVQTPTLGMIVRRDRQIESHRPTPFWKIILDMGGWHLTSQRIDQEPRARHLLDIMDMPGMRVTITKVERKRQDRKPPRLYDLTGLQKDMSRMHGAHRRSNPFRIAEPVRAEAGHLPAHRQPVHHARRFGNPRPTHPERRPCHRIHHPRHAPRPASPGPDRQRQESRRPHRDPAHSPGQPDMPGRLERTGTARSHTNRTSHVGSRQRRPNRGNHHCASPHQP